MQNNRIEGEYSIAPEQLERILYHTLLHIKHKEGIVTEKTKIKHTFEDLYVVHIKFLLSPTIETFASLYGPLGPYINRELTDRSFTGSKMSIYLHTKFVAGSKDIILDLLRQTTFYNAN